MFIKSEAVINKGRRVRIKLKFHSSDYAVLRSFLAVNWVSLSPPFQFQRLLVKRLC